MITRRSAIAILGAAAVLPLPGYGSPGNRLYLNAYGERGGFGLAAFDVQGEIRYRLMLPGRGHSFACHADRALAVAFSRRPGDYALVFDPASGTVMQLISAAQDRYFCGHGAFSADGRVMFATEVIGSTGDGVAGIYDAADSWRRIGEYRTHGLDPHEIRLLPDGRTLAIANGGILMRADMPRLKLNIPDMDPSLVYLDSRDGSMIRQVRPERELRQLSIRHIAIDRYGRVAVAMQYEGPEQDAVPLVALHDGPGGSDTFQYLPMPEAQRVAMRQYCGSTTVDSTGRFLAVSSPRGNRVLVWNLASESLVQAAQARDVCGVAAAEANITSTAEAGFILSSGLGGLFRLSAQHDMDALAGSGSRLQWDNHMICA